LMPRRYTYGKYVVGAIEQRDMLMEELLYAAKGVMNVLRVSPCRNRRLVMSSEERACQCGIRQRSGRRDAPAVTEPEARAGRLSAVNRAKVRLVVRT